MSGFNNYSIENIPVYLLSVDDPKATIQTVSLVECPATGLPLYCFEKEEKYKFSTDELKHNIISCIVRVDYPILRTSADGEPYYVVFNKETSEMLCQKLLKDGFQQNISLDHNGQLIEGIQLEQVFIKDSSRGIVPSGFESAADGSLFGIYHITDDSLWNDCISGRFGGVSLESLFKLIPISNIDERKKLNQYKMSNKISKIKEAIKNLLLQFSEIETDKGILSWEADLPLDVGMAVYINDLPAPDGEYVYEGKCFVVVDGKISEVKPVEPKPEEDPKPMEDPKPEQMEEDPKPMEEDPKPMEDPVPEVTIPAEVEARITALEEKIKELTDKVVELTDKLAELSTTPASKPVVEEFEDVAKPKNFTDDKKLNKRIALAAALKG